MLFVTKENVHPTYEWYMNKLMLLLCLIKSRCDFLVNDIELFTDVSVMMNKKSTNYFGF